MKETEALQTAGNKGAWILFKDSLIALRRTDAFERLAGVPYSQLCTVIPLYPLGIHFTHTLQIRTLQRPPPSPTAPPLAQSPTPINIV